MASTGESDSGSTRSCEICSTVVQRMPLRGGGTLLRCAACGHVLRDLTLCPASHRGFAYGGEVRLDKARLRLTFRALTRDGVPGSVFEIGFGAGQLLRRFLDAGARTGGVDPDQLGLGVDPAVVASGGLHTGRIETMEAPERNVDLVYAVHVIEHVVTPAAMLATAFDMLVPGGRIQLFTPAADSTSLARFGAGWWLLEDPTHVRFFSADSMTRALTAAGFEHVHVRRSLLDNLTMEWASAVRRLRPRTRANGVLASRAVLAGGLASVPFVVVWRLLSPCSRPTLDVTATRPACG